MKLFNLGFLGFSYVGIREELVFLSLKTELFREESNWSEACEKPSVVLIECVAEIPVLLSVAIQAIKQLISKNMIATKLHGGRVHLPGHVVNGKMQCAP